MYLFTQHLLQLLRCKDDVFVIRQNDVFFILSIFHAGREFLYGRIHGLTTGHHIGAHFFKELGPAIAGNHSQDAQRFLGHFLLLFFIFMELIHHVIAFDVVEGSPVRSHIEHVARALRVDVYLHQVVPGCYNHGFTPRREFLSHFFGFHFAWADDEFGAVRIFDGEGFALRFQAADDRFHIDFDIFHFTGEAIEATHEEENQALSAGIHYIGIFQDLQLFRCLSQCFVAGVDGCFEDFTEICFVLVYIMGTFGDTASDGKDGAFHRFRNSAVRIEDAILESLAHLAAGSGLLSMKAAADAVDDLRQNDAGISASAHDSTGRGLLCDDAHRLLRAHISDHAVHRFQCIQHIISCIAIRHRKYIQLIDDFILFLK